MNSNPVAKLLKNLFLQIPVFAGEPHDDQSRGTARAVHFSRRQGVGVWRPVVTRRSPAMAFAALVACLAGSAVGIAQEADVATESSSVKPGINEKFLDPSLDVSEWLGRFEIESREVYASRDEVLKACEIEPGDSVADIGAGTGFYSRLFASEVGEKGWVYAVDISSRFLEHINLQAREEQVHNLTGVLCSDRSVHLPPDSVDLVFTCDTYHHFEYPQSTLASIHRALKKGGKFVVIDFERIPGESREFILGHVRAGKEVFRSEIEKAGFKFVDEVTIPGFKENYLLRFQKD